MTSSSSSPSSTGRDSVKVAPLKVLGGLRKSTDRGAHNGDAPKGNRTPVPTLKEWCPSH